MIEQRYSDEISLKDVILVGKDYVSEMWSRKIWYVLAIAVLGGYMGYKAWATPTKFISEKKFYVESDNSGVSGGGIGGLLGSLVGGEKENPWKVIQVSNSNLIIKDVLFSKEPSSGLLLINQILDVYGLREQWAIDKATEPFLKVNFTHDTIEKMNFYEQASLKRIINMMLLGSGDGPLRELKLDDEWGHFEIQSKTIDRSLTEAINDLTYDVTRNYFEEKSIASYRLSRTILKEKSDSIEVLLRSKLYELARYEDSNRSLITRTGNVEGEILQQEVLAFSSAHSELRKAFEMADFNYQSKKPTFRMLDYTIPPLPAEKPSWRTGFIKGATLAIVLLSFLFIALKLYRDIMSSVENDQ